jgi:hypothetical protein
MPRYFDFWEDGNLIADDEGTDVLETAKDEAVVDLSELMKEILTAGGSHELKLILRDESGEELLELALNYQEKIPTKIIDGGPLTTTGRRPTATIGSTFALFAAKRSSDGICVR